MSDIDSDLLFKGHTPGSISCEAFVRAVRKHSVDQNKARDDEYIADYAMSCLIDDALHWSEDLPKEVQRDWSLLRQALLVEYGSSTRKSPPEIPSLPSAMVSVPAAAPLPAAAAPLALTPPLAVSPSQIIRGRMKVVGPNFTRYLSKKLNIGTFNLTTPKCLVTDKMSDASILSGTMGDGGFQFKFKNLDAYFSHLEPNFGVVWQSDPYLDTEINTLATFSIVKSQGTTATRQMYSSGNGPVSWVTWIRAPDNTLTPTLEGLPEVGIAVSGKRLVVASQINEFVVANNVWHKVRFVFEPL